MEDTAPTLLTLAQIPWMAKYIVPIQAKLGSRITADLDAGLTVAEDVSEEELLSAASFLHETKEKSSQIIRILNRWLGDLICWYAAKHRITQGEAIDALQLADATGKKTASLKKLAKIVSELPPDILSLENLTFSHFDAATSFARPGEPDQIRAWKEKVNEILRMAAQSPEDRTRVWVCQMMRELQKEFNISPSRPVASSVLLDVYSRLCYILDHWNEDNFLDAGYDRGQVTDWRTNAENELIVRQIMLPPDPKSFVPPWQGVLDTKKAPTEDRESLDEEDEEEEAPALEADLSIIPREPDEEDDELLPIQ